MQYDKQVHYFVLNGKRVDIRKEFLEYTENCGRIDVAVEASLRACLIRFTPGEDFAVDPGAAMSSFLRTEYSGLSTWLDGDESLEKALKPHIDEAAVIMFVSTNLTGVLTTAAQKFSRSLNDATLSAEQRTVLLSQVSGELKNVVRGVLSDYLKTLLEIALSRSIGTVCGDSDLRGLKPYIEKRLSAADQLTDEELADFLSLAPSNEKLLGVAYKRFGDNQSRISIVAEAFGLSCESIKLDVFNREIGSAAADTEEGAIALLKKATELSVYLNLSASTEACAKLNKLRVDVEWFDQQYRTVGNVVYATRIEADMTRRDVKRLEEELGEDPTPFLGYARFNPEPVTGRTKGADLTGRLSDLIAAFPQGHEDSPFLNFVRRALAHARDFGHFAGNARYESWREAKPVREEKAKTFSSHVASATDPKKMFALDADLFDSGIMSVLSFFKKENSDAAFRDRLVARYFGERLPENAHDFEGILRWQAGFDLYDPCEESVLEISPDAPDKLTLRKIQKVELVMREVEPIPSSAAVHCSSCGAELAKDAKFCRKCGHRV